MKNYYVLSNGRIKRQQNTVYIENAAGEKKPIPVEDVDSLYVYGEVDVNTKLLVFLSQKHIPLHVFNYYGFYSGSYYPRDYLHSGFLLVHQVEHYSDAGRRLALAQELVRASAHSLAKTVAYYARRKDTSAPETEPPGEITGEVIQTGVPTDIEAEAGIDEGLGAASLLDEMDGEHPFPLELPAGLPSTLAHTEASIRSLAALIDSQADVSALMGIEGKMRNGYYAAWSSILAEGWSFNRRVRRPPDNEVNALISFGNSMLYTVCLSEIYRTQLTPTISYLHEPGARRFSLALDLSEIFKPLIVDRAIFRLINTGQLKPEHFDQSMNACYLNDVGKKLFLSALEDRLGATIKHRRLNRHVSYRHLIRLECYKLIRHLTRVEPYRAFRAWW